jgi:hypothetical protein
LKRTIFDPEEPPKVWHEAYKDALVEAMLVYGQLEDIATTTGEVQAALEARSRFEGLREALNLMSTFEAEEVATLERFVSLMDDLVNLRTYVSEVVLDVHATPSQRRNAAFYVSGVTACIARLKAILAATTGV